MLATPGLLRPDQSLPAASTPAPGPHTRRQDRFRGRALASACQIALGPFQSRIGRLFPARFLETFPSRPVGPRGFRTSHEPLYETIPDGITAVTRWRAMVSCDPWSFRHTSAPEVHRCSQVSPRPVDFQSSPKEIFRRLGGGDAFTGFSPAPRTISFCLTASRALPRADILSFLDLRQGILAAN